jgi:hypothetical protein
MMPSYYPSSPSANFKKMMGPLSTRVLMTRADHTTMKTEQKERAKWNFFLPASL